MARPRLGKEIGASVLLTVRLRPDQEASLQRLAKSYRSTLAAEVRRAIDVYLDVDQDDSRRLDEHRR